MIPKFGHQMLDYFPLDKNFINLNHGSYGCTPLMVLEEKNKIELKAESNPDLFLRYNLYETMDNLRNSMSKYLNADFEDIVFI